MVMGDDLPRQFITDRLLPATHYFQCAAGQWAIFAHLVLFELSGYFVFNAHFVRPRQTASSNMIVSYPTFHPSTARTMAPDEYES